MSATADYSLTEGKESKPSKAGLLQYVDDILTPKLFQRPFKRIVLIDRSTKGDSLDGFRRAFVDMLDVAQRERSDTYTERVVKALKKKQMAFINVVDWKRQETTVPPKSDKITQVAKVTVQSNEGFIDRLLRDNDPHPRLQPDYPPRLWVKTQKEAWKLQGGSGNKKDQVEAIIKFNQYHGGLLNKNYPQPGNYPNIKVIKDDPKPKPQGHQ